MRMISNQVVTRVADLATPKGISAEDAAGNRRTYRPLVAAAREARASWRPRYPVVRFTVCEFAGNLLDQATGRHIHYQDSAADG